MKRALVVFALVTAFTLFLPVCAFAAEGDYAIDELSSEVTVESNAAVSVVERQVVTFDTRNTGFIWHLHAPEDGESVRISAVRAAPVDDGGALTGDWTRLQLVDSRPMLQGREPGDTAALSIRNARTQPWYSYNIGDGMVRCWFPVGPDVAARAAKSVGTAKVDAANTAVEGGSSAEAAGDAGSSITTDADTATDTTRYVIEAHYTVAHRVRVYRDVAELYWRYANSSLPVDAFDVNLQAMLPVPEEALPVAPGADVMAWGHGPDDGTLVIGEDGTVTCHVDEVPRGNYAEVHVIFPSWWLGNVVEGSANTFTETRRTTAMSEEAQWVDASKRGETWDFEVRILFLALAAAIILVGMAAVARYGRSTRSRRALVRMATTLGITALGAQLFFREPVTTALLAAIAAIVAIASLMLPAADEPYGADEPDEGREGKENR